MIKRHLITGFASAAAVFSLAAPAFAQDTGPQSGGNERINQLIIYGDDACPPSTADEITVCARKDESERFRIPPLLRGSSTDPANEAWTQRVLAYETVGATGVSSCSPVGSGGDTGCMMRLINASYQEKAGAPEVEFGQLIAEERARRLEAIDATAAEEQARVEAAEAEYFARQKAEQDAASDAAEATEAPLPAPPQ